MKIKQSFIAKCREITVKQIREISKLADRNYATVIWALLEPNEWHYASDIWKATANVLKIDLSDIYEVEQLPNTLTE